jgi:hypothetical protein
MVLQFKVWRLQWEKRGGRDKTTKDRTLVLVLRDKDGKIRKIASNITDQSHLEKWYEKYNIGERLERLLKSRKLKLQVRKTKDRIRERGFTHSMSLYGIWVNPKTGERGYRRYEIFKAYKWMPDEVAFLHDFFKTHIPKSPAGVFVFHDGSLFIDEKDELTKFGKHKPKRTT